MARKKHGRKRHRRATAPGSPPGTLELAEEKTATLSVLAYSVEQAHAINPARLEDALALVAENTVTWINVVGVGDTALLLRLGEQFKLHMLSLEDSINVLQRAKFESYDDYDFCVVRMFRSRTESEQLCIFHSGKVVITIQERGGDYLKSLRERIEKKAGQVRVRESDYLVYAIIDSVLDHYFPIVEEYNDILETLDEKLVDDRSLVSLHEIHRLKRELVDLRKWLRPHREMVSQLLRSESSGINQKTMVYMRDCYDHVVRLSEGIDDCLEMCSSLRDFHFNAVSNKTNEVMKTLTIISTIFIPLSFLAGVYGMNFENMPGLGWRYGFGALSLGMLAAGGTMLGWFYRRGWFS